MGSYRASRQQLGTKGQNYDSEFSWGPGLVPPGYENAPHSEGGMYRPKCPPVDLPSPNSLRPRQVRRKRTDPPASSAGTQIRA